MLEVTPPSGDEEDEKIKKVEDEIQKDINEHTEFEASVFVGRTEAVCRPPRRGGRWPPPPHRGGVYTP